VISRIKHEGVIRVSVSVSVTVSVIRHHCQIAIGVIGASHDCFWIAITVDIAGARGKAAIIVIE
jgi:hypothetical protein